jgi:hypothetical protein
MTTASTTRYVLCTYTGTFNFKYSTGNLHTERDPSNTGPAVSSYRTPPPHTHPRLFQIPSGFLTFLIFFQLFSAPVLFIIHFFQIQFQRVITIFHSQITLLPHRYENTDARLVGTTTENSKTPQATSPDHQSGADTPQNHSPILHTHNIVNFGTSSD